MGGMTTAPGQVPVAPQVPRHPLDPEPVRATKARAVFALGLMAAVTGLFVGGIVPAAVALQLSRQARREAYASGVSSPARPGCGGERLAWTGLVLAAVTLVTVVVIGVVQLAEAPFGHDYPSTVD